MKGRQVLDYDVKPAYPRCTEIETIHGHKLKIKPSRTPLVQIGRGPIDSDTYQTLRRAYKQHAIVDYQRRRYYVAKLAVGEGRFEARLVEAISCPLRLTSLGSRP